MIIEEWSFSFLMMTIKGPLIMLDHHEPSIIVMHYDDDGRVMTMIKKDHDNDDGRS